MRLAAFSHQELGLDSWANVVVATGGVPVPNGEDGDGEHEDDDIVHLRWISHMKLYSGRENRAYVLRSHRPNGWHYVDNRDEGCPHHGPEIDRQTSPSQMEWPALEFAI